MPPVIEDKALVAGKLTSDDVLEIAQRIERNGVRFYIAASQMAGFGAMAASLTNLAEMEARHEKDFSDMRKRLAKGAGGALPLDPGDQTTGYLQQLVAGKFFAPAADPLDWLSGTSRPQDVLMTAIGMEKESIAFYLGVKEVVADPDDKVVVDHVISEERDHICQLSAQLAKLGGPAR